jgi:hypothetical protein
MQNDLILALESYKTPYQILHDTINPFRGFSLNFFIPNLSTLIRDSNIRTALDYGCGRAEPHEIYRLKDLWDLDILDKYDPGIKQWSDIPTSTYDLVFCIDVMEHLEENHIDIFLSHIHSLTIKVAFFSISIRPAAKNLPDGSNAHKTIRPARWWQKKVDNIFKDKLAIVNFSL